MSERGLGRSFRPLRQRDFALLWSSSLVSTVGTWMQTVAVGALVTERTGKATWTALVAVAAFLPVGLLAPVGGAIADRTDRRRWLAFGTLLETALAGILTALSATGRASPGVVTFVVFLGGCMAALLAPVQQSLVPDLVPHDDVLAASSLGMAQYNLGRVVGPALAAVVIAVGSFTLAFAVNAVSFLAVVIAVLLIRLPPRRPAPATGLIRSIQEGARVAWSEPGCRAAIVLIAVAAFLVSPFIALIPAKAAGLVDGEKAVAAATGVLTTAQGVGAVIGALLVAPVAARFGRRRVVVAALTGASLALCAYAAAPTTVSAVAALSVVGMLYVSVLTGLSTVVLLRSPAEHRARATSLFFVALGVIYPLGALVQGAVADRIGLAATTTAGALALIGVVAGIRAARPGFLDALEDTPAEPAIAGEALGTAAQGGPTADSAPSD
ncbi:MAG TPA: MFS transporter [Acidimicrobiales bacterium]|nr:MFS transporter [Acidimicrobiales bacterium]